MIIDIIVYTFLLNDINSLLNKRGLLLFNGNNSHVLCCNLMHTIIVNEVMLKEFIIESICLYRSIRLIKFWVYQLIIYIIKVVRKDICIYFTKSKY